MLAFNMGPAVLYEDPVEDDGKPDSAAAMQRLVQWSYLHSLCMSCLVDQQRAEFLFWPGLETHHMVKRSRFVCHEAWNLLRLCSRCHQLFEGHTIRHESGEEYPRLEFGHALWMKREHDDRFWSPLRLAMIYDRPLPALEPPPPLIQRERERNQSLIPWRNLN